VWVQPAAWPFPRSAPSRPATAAAAAHPSRAKFWENARQVVRQPSANLTGNEQTFQESGPRGNRAWNMTENSKRRSGRTDRPSPKRIGAATSRSAMPSERAGNAWRSSSTGKLALGPASRMRNFKKESTTRIATAEAARRARRRGVDFHAPPRSPRGIRPGRVPNVVEKWFIKGGVSRPPDAAAAKPA